MKKLFHLLLIVITLITAISFQSCSDEKYTIWTDTGSYSEFQNAFQTTLTDGYFIRIEIRDSDWAELSKSLTSDGKHRWDEATIKKWLIDIGFGTAEAGKEASWLTLVNHGLIVLRENNIVYYVLK